LAGCGGDGTDGVGGDKESCIVTMRAAGVAEGSLCLIPQDGNELSECTRQSIDQEMGSDNVEITSAYTSNGCPNGADLVCNDSEGIIYLYGSVFSGASCSEIFD